MSAYSERYRAYTERFEEAKRNLESLEEQKAARLAKADAVSGFMFALSERDEPLTEFDNMLWMTAVESVLVHSDGRLTFRFFNDTEIDG